MCTWVCVCSTNSPFVLFEKKCNEKRKKKSVCGRHRFRVAVVDSLAISIPGIPGSRDGTTIEKRPQRVSSCACVRRCVYLSVVLRVPLFRDFARTSLLYSDDAKRLYSHCRPQNEKRMSEDVPRDRRKRRGLICYPPGRTTSCRAGRAARRATRRAACFPR